MEKGISKVGEYIRELQNQGKGKISMDKVWPDGVRCGVGLSFDVDAETFWFSRNKDSFSSPNLLAEGAYGPRVAVPRILKMLDRLDLKATFFVPGWVIEKHTEIIKEVVDRGHEIGYHGYLHERVFFPEEHFELINRSKKIMQDLLGVVPVSHRAPEAEMDTEILELLANMEFKYSSNLMDADRPYFHRLSNHRKLVELPIHWVFDDSSHFFFTVQEPARRPIAAPSTVREIWQGEFDGIYEEGGSMVLTLHPQIIGRVSRLKMLEELLDYMKNREGTVVGPIAEVCRLAARGLENS